MRPRSLIGPIILVGLGVLFLMHNLRPDWSLLDLLSRTWPYLLIGWGVLRIIEIVAWRAQNRPLPQSGLSGGEWTFVILFSLLGSGFYFLHQSAPWDRLGRIRIQGVEVFGDAYDFPLAEQSLACGKTPRVVVENLRGNVRVVGIEADKVTVSGRTTVRALQNADAEKANAAATLEITGQPDQVIVRTNQERVTGESRISSDLEIRVPKGSSIVTRGRRGDVELIDLGGSVEVTSENAGVRLQNVGSAVRVDLRDSDLVRVSGAKGNVVIEGSGRDIEVEQVAGEVSVSGSYSGDLVLRQIEKAVRFQSRNTEFLVEKLPGEVRFDLGDFRAVNLEGPIRLKTRSKDVHFEDFTARLDLEVDRGDVTVQPRRGIPEIDVKVRAGNIDLSLPPNAKFQLNATTERGEVSNDFGEAIQVKSEGRGGTMLSEAKSGPTIRLSTNRGNITLGREPMGAIPAPPAPPTPPRPPRRGNQSMTTETF